MKKMFRLLLLVGLLGGANNVSAAEQVTSDVGITFYQSNVDQQLVPMKKIIVTKTENDGPSTDSQTKQMVKSFPATNEKKNYLLTASGNFFLGLSGLLYSWEAKRRKEGAADEKE